MSGYDVGISISLLDNVSAGLAAMGSRMSAIGAQAAQLNNTLMMIGKGAGLAFVGVQGLQALTKPLEAAKEYQTEVTRFKALGLGDHITSEADKVARGMNIMGASSLESMKMLKEATTITGSFEHAKEVTPTLLKMKFGIESVMSGHGEKFDAQIQGVLKTAELRGALIDKSTGQMSMEKFTAAVDAMTKAYVASGGLVKPSDYLQAIKTGGVAAKTMNDDAFMGLGHFIQESGGSRTGTSTMSMFQAWAMGKMTQKAAERMMDLGLLNKDAVHISPKSGHITGVDIGGLKGIEQFRENPFKYVNDVVKPLLEKQGYKGEDLNMQLAGILGNRTASNLADTMVREQKVAELYNERSKLAMGVESLYKAGGDTMQGKEIDYEAQKNKLLVELGTSVLPMACKGLEMLITVVKSVTQFAQDFPTLTKGLVVGFAALMGAMAIGGTIMVLVGGFRLLSMAMGTGQLLTIMPMVKTAITALGQGIMFLGRALFMNPIGLTLTAVAIAGYLVYKNWSTIKPMLDNLWNAMKQCGKEFMLAGVAIGATSIALKMLAVSNTAAASSAGVAKIAMMGFAGALGAVAAAVAGYAAGMAAQEHFINPLIKKASGGKSGSIGESIFNMVNGHEVDQLLAPSKLPTHKKDGGTALVPFVGAGNNPINVTTNLNVDGHKMATVVTKHQSKAANKPQTGTSRFDGKMALGVVGAH